MSKEEEAMRKEAQDDFEKQVTLVEELVEPRQTSRGLFRNGNQVVHIVQTRFMQHQRELTHLARARMELFRTITLPSMMQQTKKEFLWIIWMEPQLEDEVKREFLELIQQARDELNIVVIGSRVKLPDLRDELYEEFMASSIYTGNYDLLLDYREAAQTRVLVDTTLDADDAVFYDFAHSVQTEASNSLATSRVQFDFRIWCASQTLYWGYYNPWYEASTRGHLIPKTTKSCPTGAYTKGYAVGTLPSHLPQVPRHEIHTQTPSCDYLKHKCLSRMQPGSAEFAILRALTPAAVNVAASLPKSKSVTVQTSSWKTRQEEGFSKLKRSFGVSQTSIKSMRAALESNMLAIILDGMQGMCSEGHSCKREDKTALRELKLKYKYPGKDEAPKD